MTSEPIPTGSEIEGLELRADVVGFTVDQVRKFLTLVERRGPDECWPWLGGRSRKRRGLFQVRENRMVASRMMLCLWTNQPPKPGILACHSCDNPPCCNPHHLWWGTNRENLLDAVAKRRTRQSAVTHCPQGHPYSGDNLIIDLRGHRKCRGCQAGHWRKVEARRRAERAARAAAAAFLSNHTEAPNER